MSCGRLRLKAVNLIVPIECNENNEFVIKRETFNFWHSDAFQSYAARLMDGTDENAWDLCFRAFNVDCKRILIAHSTALLQF